MDHARARPKAALFFRPQGKLGNGVGGLLRSERTACGTADVRSQQPTRRGFPGSGACRQSGTRREPSQGNDRSMGTILIDKLLSAAVKQGASDLHITVGQPPVLRISGRMQKLKTKVLEPADTAALMKSIAPERCQQELQETGSADFG